MGEFFVYPSLLKKFNGVSEGYDKSARKTNTASCEIEIRKIS